METDLDGLDPEDGVPLRDRNPNLERVGETGEVPRPGEAAYVDPVADDGRAGARAGRALHPLAWRQPERGRMGRGNREMRTAAGNMDVGMEVGGELSFCSLYSTKGSARTVLLAREEATLTRRAATVAATRFETLRPGSGLRGTVGRRGLGDGGNDRVHIEGVGFSVHAWTHQQSLAHHFVVREQGWAAMAWQKRDIGERWSSINWSL